MAPRVRAIAGFSLIELVIVVVIMGIIAAIAIPRISRGAEGAREQALKHDLDALRRAIQLYETEHQGLIPKNKSTITAELTQYTDITGDVNASPKPTHIYGPYIRSIPMLPVGKNRGSAAIRDGGNPGDGSEGWWYNNKTGWVVANTKDAEVDSTNKPYNTY